MKKKVLLCAAICSLILAMGVGCSEQSSSESSQASSQVTASTHSTDTASHNAIVPASSAPNGKEVTATLYIGYEGKFKEYPHQFKGSPTPDQLIKAIADETGWNLTLADITTSGKGGITVSFSKESALFTGPPNPQKDEFHTYDVTQLDRTILDSIQKTLQKNFVSNLGDPNNLNIYFSMEGDKALELPNTDVTIPMESPYSTQIWDQAAKIKG